MKTFFFTFALVSFRLWALTFQDKFESAEVGSYIVMEQRGVASVLHLYSKRGIFLLFEEISIPLQGAKKKNWADWLRADAPGHTSWILYEIDLKKKEVTECYSLTRQAWISASEMGTFFIPLLSLELLPLSKEKQLQKGASQKAGAVSGQPWHPPQIVDGEKVQCPQYNVYTAQWPEDSTDLSGSEMIFYFDSARETFPFPYWVQMREGPMRYKLRAIDSGVSLSSPLIDLPRR